MCGALRRLNLGMFFTSVKSNQHFQIIHIVQVYLRAKDNTNSYHYVLKLLMRLSGILANLSLCYDLRYTYH